MSPSIITKTIKQLPEKLFLITYVYATAIKVVQTSILSNLIIQIKFPGIKKMLHSKDVFSFE